VKAALIAALKNRPYAGAVDARAIGNHLAMTAANDGPVHSLRVKNAQALGFGVSQDGVRTNFDSFQDLLALVPGLTNLRYDAAGKILRFDLVLDQGLGIRVRLLRLRMGLAAYQIFRRAARRI
jgi:hypothetical protein